ncbi:MAG: IgGFc-binding protein [Byssovorax sp.]
MSHRHLLGIALIGMGWIGACAATGASGSGQTGTGGAAASGTTAQGTGGAAGSSGTFTTGAGGVGGIACETHCSSDLHNVVDCNGNVVAACPADQGCGSTGCVPACESARQNKSTIGCDYYSVPPDTISEGEGACFAAYITNTWGSPITISVERGGQLYDVGPFARVPSGTGKSITYANLPNGQLEPGKVAILFLARFGANLVDCPAGVTPALTDQLASIHGTGKGSAFHIVTSAPVVAYDIFPYGGGQSAATSATLLLPTTVWDTNYVAVDAFRKSQLVVTAQPSIDIVGAEDGTTVTINPTVPIIGGAGVQGSAANVPVSYQLNKGQVLQLSQDTELIGSAIQADKPIGLWGAASCLSIDVNAHACDSAHQQIPPVKALGSAYAAVRYRNRFQGIEESPPWRVVGAVDGTVLTYEPEPPQGAPLSLSLGQVGEFNTPGPFTVRSQDPDHPFYMSAHMTGCTTVSPPGDCRGDPEFVNVIPLEQYLRSYTFFTDPTYPETNLVLVRQADMTGFHDVKLDCAGTVNGWMPLGNNGTLQYARIDLVTNNFLGVNGCDNGLHEIHSDAPFGLTVWGWGTALSDQTLFSQAVSYAYPAGASVQPINTVVVPVTPK